MNFENLREALEDFHVAKVDWYIKSHAKEILENKEIQEEILTKCFLHGYYTENMVRFFKYNIKKIHWKPEYLEKICRHGQFYLWKTFDNWRLKDRFDTEKCFNALLRFMKDEREASFVRVCIQSTP